MIVVVSPTPDGAVGGATTFDDIQSAIETLRTQGGGTVYVRRGTYVNTATKPSLVLYDNITIEGEGTATVLRASVSTPAIILNDQNPDSPPVTGMNQRIFVRNLFIDGAGLATFGVSLRNSSYCRVENLFIQTCTFEGVYMDAASAATDIDICGCTVFACGRNGVAYGSGAPGRRIRVVGCTFVACAHFGVDFEPAHDSLISNCQAVLGTGVAPPGLQYAGGGFVITGEVGHDDLAGNRIENCSAFDNKGPGILLGKTVGCLVTSCVSSRNEHGIYVSSSCLATQLNGNHLVGNKKAGIIVFRGETQSAERTVISGNVSSQNGQYGIQVGGDNATITGNLCAGNGTERPGGALAYDGIRLDKCWRGNVVGNQCLDSLGDQPLTADAAIGATFLQVANTRDFYPNQLVRITGGTAEERVVLGVVPPNQVALTAGLSQAHTVSGGARLQGRPSQRYGIFLRACDSPPCAPPQGTGYAGGKHVVSGNVAFGNGQGQIQDDTDPNSSIVVNNITT